MPKTELRSTIRTSTERRILRYLELSQQRKQLEKELADLKEDIGDALSKAEGNIIETDDFSAQLVKSVNSRIDKEKLAALGVTPSIIRRATIETPYAYPKVTPKKKSDD